MSRYHPVIAFLPLVGFLIGTVASLQIKYDEMQIKYVNSVTREAIANAKLLLIETQNKKLF